jgi:hypothetical protein
VNPLCSVICQIVEPPTTRPYDEPYINVIGEIVIPNGRTEDACRVFLQRMDELNEESLTVHLKVYGDASGDKRHTSAAKTDYQTIESVFKNRGAYKLTMKQLRSNPPILDRVSEANTMLRSFDGKSRIFIDPKCKGLIRDLKEVAWKHDRFGNRINDLSETVPELTHLSDALCYLVWSEFRFRPPCGLRPGTVC